MRINSLKISSKSPVAVKTSTPVKRTTKVLLISTSKKHKHKSNRSAFFARLMTKLAGDTGNEIADMLVNQDIDGFKEAMYKIVDDIAASASKTKPKVE